MSVRDELPYLLRAFILDQLQEGARVLLGLWLWLKIQTFHTDWIAPSL